MCKNLVIAAVALLTVTAFAFGQMEAAKKPAMTVEGKLCTSIENRMPVGTATSFTADVGKVYLWCQITGAAGETTIKHVWYHQGKEMATVELPVRGASWRTYSSKTIPENWTGDWEVKVMDAEGNTLATIPFTVGKTAEKPVPAEAKQPGQTSPKGQ